MIIGKRLPFGWMIILVIIGTSIGVLVIDMMDDTLHSPEYSDLRCCNGSVCSDTYYDLEIDRCVLTLTCNWSGGCVTYEPYEIEVWE